MLHGNFGDRGQQIAELVSRRGDGLGAYQPYGPPMGGGGDVDLPFGPGGGGPQMPVSPPQFPPGAGIGLPTQPAPTMGGEPGNPQFPRLSQQGFSGLGSINPAIIALLQQRPELAAAIQQQMQMLSNKVPPWLQGRWEQVMSGLGGLNA